MALASSKRLSQYGAVVRDSTVMPLSGPLPKAFTVAESTVQHLVDPKTNQELCIVGTTNLSHRLALRTQKLISAYQPDAVLVQASPYFFDASRAPVKTHEALQAELKRSGYLSILASEGRTEFTTKGLLYLYRRSLMSLWMHNWMRTPANWQSVLTPGLEMKFALDYAESAKASVYYAGEEFNRETHMRLETQTDFDVIWPLLKFHLVLNESWVGEFKDNRKLLQLCELKDLCEQHFHKDSMAWWVRFFATMFPGQKKSIIDQRDEDMFTALEKKLKGNKKLAVVNQWHMEGLERLWRANHGLAIKRPATTGTEDFPLAENQAYMDGIDADREKIEKMTATPMATHSRTLVPYNDETRSHYG